MTRRVIAFCLACLCAMLGAWSPASAAAGIAVLYPDIGEPYLSVFTRIIDGIESQTRSKVPSFAVGSRTSSPELAETLRRQDVRVVIALGKHGLKAAEGLGGSVGVVGGGVVSASQQEAASGTILTLAPDPALLFARLRAFVPGVRRVFAVYDPQQNAWLMRIARDAAKAHGLELVLLEAHDLKTALRHYQDILGRIDGRQDALWLPQDSTTVDDSSVLPVVIQECWDRNVPLFSSSVAHVKRGALFALYPNNEELGRSLAQSALAQLGGGGPRGLVPLRDVLVAANTRTASHLGLSLSLRQQQGIDLLFPQP